MIIYKYNRKYFNLLQYTFVADYCEDSIVYRVVSLMIKQHLDFNQSPADPNGHALRKESLKYFNKL